MKERIYRLNNALLALVATGCFVLSFAKLQPFAVAAGTPPRLAWILPLILDGTIAIAILGHWQAVVVGQDVTPFRALNISCAGLSVGFNVWQALNNSPDSVVQPVAVAALAPVLLWASSETILRNVLHGVSGTSAETSGDVHLHKHDHLHLTPEPPVSGELTPVIEQRREQVARLIEQNVSVSDVARQLGVSRGTVYADRQAIEQGGVQCSAS